jgi:GTP-binding protein Era
LTVPPAQLIFIDTPGIFVSKEKYEKKMVKEAFYGMDEADMNILIVDAKKGICSNTETAIKRLKGKENVIIAINKVDVVDKRKLLELAAKLQTLSDKIFMISALKGDGVEDIKEYLLENAQEGGWLYPEDQISNIAERVLAGEITREKLFIRLEKELPYSLTVITDEFVEREKDIKIYQTIYVERVGQKKIITSHIKDIVIMSRKELTRLFEKTVHLFLFIKVKSDWKDKIREE